MPIQQLKFTDALTQIIATPSISCVNPAIDQTNRPVIELLANWLSDYGFAVELMPIENHPGKLNLIACLGRGEGGLVLSGHTDTVPCNESHWGQDPFKLTEKDNKFYGLGVSDMKNFFPIVLDVLNGLDIKNPKQPIYILATADEESNMSGARALVDSGHKLGRYALIGEPTGLSPIYMHKGVLMESIRLTGKAGHSSNPALGNNALEGMYRVIQALILWREELQHQHQNDAFEIPIPTLNFGSIHGGDNPNRICAECVLSLDMRLLPGMELEQTRKVLHDVARKAVAHTGLDIEMESFFDGVPSMYTSPQSEVVRLAEKLSGHTAGSVAFGTEASYLNAMGMETVILGAGNIDQAHQANEYLEMSRIEPMKQIVGKMIQHFCLEEMKHVS